MVGCCAFGCKNRHKRGMKMKYFPKDTVRRKIWTEQVNRVGWTPTDYSALCEAHFESSMWEKTRVDGTRKLKFNAIPTIFSSIPTTSKYADAESTDLPDTCKMEYLETETKYSLREASTLNADCETMRNVQSKTTIPIDHCNTYEMENKELKSMPTNNVCSSTTTSSSTSNACLITNNLKQEFNPTEKALNTKLFSENNGYEEIVQEDKPSDKLSIDHLLNLNFEGGILNEVFQLLQQKLTFRSDGRNDCAVFLQEVVVTPADVYDAALDTDSNNMTLNNHSGVVTHILVVLLGGLNLWWKQIVAFYYTGNFANASTYEEILLKVIDKTEQIGLKVASICFNMDSTRQVLCTKWNITTNGHSQIKNYITHPLDSNRKICILADISKLFKSIKNLMRCCETLTIPNHIQQQHHLVDNMAKSRHIDDLIEFQEHLNFILMPKLNQKDLLPGKFECAAESKSEQVSHDIISGLKFLANELQQPGYKTTAWLIDTIEKWFAILISTSSEIELNKNNSNDYNKTISFLKEFIDLFCKMEISGKVWNSQTQMEVILTTQSVVNIQNIFLNQRGYDSLLISRFTQHSLGDLFHAIGLHESDFSVAQLKNYLKLICVAQLLTAVAENNDEEQEKQLLFEFLKVKKILTSKNDKDIN